MRVGFLFNHDQTHQVAHSLPVALALAEADPSIEVIAATTNQLLRTEVERIVVLHGATRVQMVELRPRRPLSRLAVTMFDRLIPASKLAIYGDNLGFFDSLDALVVTEKTSAILKTRYGLDRLRLIHTRHGAGDRAIGFDQASARFDLILVSGPKIRDRLISEAGVDPGRIAIVGYPKFDLARSAYDRLPFANPGNPTILYNPHVSPHLSSWYKDGRGVLDFFVDHPEYNLIFAPHVMLFARRAVVTIDRLALNFPGTIARRYREAPNILVDLGSSRSTDMSYTAAADLYLGDVSSQVYEFLLKRRPCIFINSHRIDYAGDPSFAHWQAGQVIADADQLGPALDRAWALQPTFEPTQKRLFDERFDLTATPSAVRAARAIQAFVGKSSS